MKLFNRPPKVRGRPARTLAITPRDMTESRPLHYAIVPRREPDMGAEIYPGTINARVVERIYQQDAPDPAMQGGAWGLLPSRVARRQIAVQAFPDGSVFGSGMGAEDFALARFGPTPHAAILPGQQQPTVQRVNIQRTPAVTYGSQYALDSTARRAA